MAATYCTDRDWLRIKVRPTISVASVRLRRPEGGRAQETADQLGELARLVLGQEGARILDPLEPRVRQVVRETVRVRRLEKRSSRDQAISAGLSNSRSRSAALLV
jgi:hypothetical protein